MTTKKVMLGLTLGLCAGLMSAMASAPSDVLAMLSAATRRLTCFMPRSHRTWYRFATNAARGTGWISIGAGRNDPSGQQFRSHNSLVQRGEKTPRRGDLLIYRGRRHDPAS